jgi:hypothetical protein
MEHEKVAGFARALVAPSYRLGKTCAIQTGGLGSLEPNTLLLGWPHKWQETGHRDSGEVSCTHSLMNGKALQANQLEPSLTWAFDSIKVPPPFSRRPEGSRAFSEETSSRKERPDSNYVSLNCGQIHAACEASVVTK